MVRVLATLAKPDGGTARIAGHDVLREPQRVRASIGLAGQHAAVDDGLTGRENLVILGLMWHLGRRAARARANELLERFGLADAGDRLVKTWSGGMQRRLDLLASQIVIIDTGLAVARGTPDELKNSLGSRVDVVLNDTADGAAALAAAQAVLFGLTGNQPRVDPDARRLSVAAAAGAVSLPEVVRRLDAAGVEAGDVSVRRPTLDEVFLAETRDQAEAAA